ncbi:CRAL/TRIO domain-containing protein [Panus rudis PR-1116 ss-1]|nr:CRAL/TRIO domain-containing protein [Panus rudis PR-1116 ss-1]
MSVYSVLESHVAALQDLYEQNAQAVRSLQETLKFEILPGLVDELELEAEKQEQALSWLQDTPSIFRILKRQKFTSSFALEALRHTLVWRMNSLPPLHIAPPSPFMQCLPPMNRDPLGHPILVVRLAGVTESSEDLRPVMLRNVELLRLHLARLNAEGHLSKPILQFVALLDIEGVSLNSIYKFDLLSWYMNELLPHFPGMLAAVFVINYSWAHSGLWNLSKRALPASALARAFFPTRQELLDYFSPNSLPQEFGGALPPLDELPDSLHQYLDVQSDTSGGRKDIAPLVTSSERDDIFTEATAHLAISPTSALNPFFGYPATITRTANSGQYRAHRRKRDLMRTLALLLWMRWRKQLTTAFIGILVCVAVLVVRKATWVRRWRWQVSWLPALGLALQLPSSLGAGAVSLAETAQGIMI